MTDLLGGDDTPTTAPVIEHRLNAVAVIRGVLALFVVTFLVTSGRNLVTGDNVPVAVVTVLVVLVFTATVPLWPAAAHRAVLDVSLAVDAAAMAILLAVTGGAASPFMPLVPLVAALPLIAFGARTGVRAAVAATVALGWVWATSPELAAAAAADVPRAALVADTRIVVALLATWGTVGAMAVLTRVVETDLRRAVDDIDVLRRIGRALDPESGLDGVARRLVTAVVDHLAAPTASVWLTDRTRPGLVMTAAAGEGGSRVRPGEEEVPREGLIAQALDAQTVVVGPARGAVALVHGADATVAVVALRGEAPAGTGSSSWASGARDGAGSPSTPARSRPSTSWRTTRARRSTTRMPWRSCERSHGPTP